MRKTQPSECGLEQQVRSSLRDMGNTSSSVFLLGIPAGDIDRNRKSLDPYFDTFCATGLFDPETLYEDVRMRVRQCWIVADTSGVYAVLLTQIGDDEKKTCRLTHWAGRDVRKWHHLICDLEAWAQDIGCGRFEIYAPINGLRVAMKYGYEPGHVVMEKDLG